MAFHPKSQPHIKAGGQHPSGAVLSYAITTQPSGKERLDCFNGPLMVMCAYNLSAADAKQFAEDFMRDGDQLKAVLPRRKFK